MLDTDTKRRIDSARDILVGKLPDPKSQVEQITIALIYKFMDDMDKEAQELGGKPKFFTGEYARCAWSKIFDPKMSGAEVVAVYGEAIQKMNQNPHIPALFRNIFKNAYLPYRDPETLKSFLKEINNFTYDHSERLGDAFEYLLSVLGSQGEAGQFRTPRHIIDFMVEIIDPQKTDVILDPACGTAGFLISSYKHILKHNSKNFDPADDQKAFDLHGVKLEEITINGKKYRGDKLNSDDRARLVKNVYGYDISPDMVRLSLVNMYLHGFNDPRIYEYDTLTSEDKWGDIAEVIMANPPFMSPKGGIKPHKRFSIESNRSEVLFVDYIAEHLTPQGRAAVIVPEGIIFQSQTTHKSLRKMLVEKDYLVGVISLPGGLFNPYSGVKTSILWIDKSLAKKTNNILFVKIESDGFDLGAQRRPIKDNDLPQAFNAICAYKQALSSGKKFDAGKWKNVLVVEKKKIGESGDFNLSGERYKEAVIVNTQWPIVALGEILTLEYGKPLKEENRKKGLYPVFGSNGIVGYHDTYLVEGPFVIVGRKGSAGAVTYSEMSGYPIDTTFFVKLQDDQRCDLKYLYFQMINLGLDKINTQSGVPGLNRNDAYKIKIPLPPLSAQQETVAEIEGYQKIVNGARQVVESYKPQIQIQPNWDMITIGSVCNLINGRAFKPSDWEKKDKGGLPIIRIQNLNNFKAEYNYYSGQVDEKIIINNGDLLFSWSGSRGTSFGPHIWHGGKAILNQHIFKVEFKNVFMRDFLYFMLKLSVTEVEENLHGGVGLVHITKGNLEKIKIPCPTVEIQKQIAAQVEEEQKLVNANKKLIDIFEQKIKDRITKVWGER